MFAAAGTARSLKTGGRVRIYDNWSQRNELIEEDEEKKRVDRDGRCCFSSAGAGCLRWFVVLILSPPNF